MIIAGIIILLFLVLTFWGISTYNGFIRKRIMVKEGWSGIGTCLQQRNDLIPNLVETVKGYAKHEQKTLEEVIKWRNQSVSAATPEQQEKAQEGLNKAMMNVMALSEQYPDLKANTNFLQLQTDLTAIEEKVNLARRYYNGTVRDYNTALGIFPSNILAGMFNFGPEVFFQEEESAKAVPKVNFN